MKELNGLLKKIMGLPMTEEQKETLAFLRARVKRGEITVQEAKESWNRKYKVWRD